VPEDDVSRLGPHFGAWSWRCGVNHASLSTPWSAVRTAQHL